MCLQIVEEQIQESDGSLKSIIAGYYKQFLNWLAFDDHRPLAVNILMLLYKIPITLVVAILSPIYIVLIALIFFASF